MGITWDPKKAASNFAKHGVWFSEVELVLYDPNAITREDDDAIGEQRFVSTGMDATGRVVTVVFSFRVATVRLISARIASPRERKAYEKGL